MGAKLSSNSKIFKTKNIVSARDPLSPPASTTSSTISKHKKSRSFVLAEDYQLPTPRTSSSGSFDTRELPYATLKTENDRMNANQFALKALFGGNYIDQVGNHIDFNCKDTKVLDVGCGAGGWIMDMATEYPAPHFTGLDKVSLFPETIRPANVSFKQHDVKLGLPYEDNTFDFVHMRLFLIAFNKYEWVEFIKEAYRVTKPNGIIQLLEVEMLDDGDEMIQTFGSLIDNIMSANDQDALIARKLPAILSDGGFKPIQHVRKSLPLDNHPLASEFLYIFDISFDTVKNIVYAMYDLSTEEKYQEIKRQWLLSRKNTSHSTWWAAAGQKVI
ncbi:hypothetical protein [Parasitella parasitica]|uniref:Methyltransferase domain-containing protein n=1 Tax=Parasitella parasitica TaxID=35722 RepID=A0A0B7N494_9FUNG|nr:hypothetical protein [Parasitella parasitica]